MKTVATILALCAVVGVDRSAQAACTYQVPDGAIVGLHGEIILDGKTIAQAGPCDPKMSVMTNTAPTGPTNQNIENVSTKASGAITQFSALDGEWQIPNKPVIQNDGQGIILYNGLLTLGGDVFLQSITAWTGSSDIWYMAVEVIEGSNIFKSSAITVSVNDVIEGEQFYDGTYNGSELWVVGVRDVTTNSAWTSMYALSATSEVWGLAIGSLLEVIGIKSTGDFPAPKCASANLWYQPNLYDQNGNLANVAWDFCGPNNTGNCVIFDNYVGPSCGFAVTPIQGGWTMSF